MKEVPKEEIYVGLKNLKNVRAGLHNIIRLFESMELDGFVHDYNKMLDDIFITEVMFRRYYEELEREKIDK